jgi:hypothetical protein
MYLVSVYTPVLWCLKLAYELTVSQQTNTIGNLTSTIYIVRYHQNS